MDPLCQRLRHIPGFGPLASTATVAAIGNGAAFRRGRDFAAWVGVVPRQYSTGGEQKLFGISKRGNVYLRRMLIHGARAVLLRVKYNTGGLGQSVSGCTGLPSVHHVTKWWSRSPTSWLVSPGPCCSPASIINISRCRPPQPDPAVEKTLRLESRKRFPLFHRHDDEALSSTKVC